MLAGSQDEKSLLVVGIHLLLTESESHVGGRFVRLCEIVDVDD